MEREKLYVKYRRRQLDVIIMYIVIHINVSTNQFF